MRGRKLIRTTLPIPGVQLLLLAILAIAVPLGIWDALYPQNTVLQDGPTILLLVASVPLLHRFPITTANLACIIMFMLLHTLAARWSYSFVPYDDWAKALSGQTISAVFGFHRNHFDRLVHFSFGLLAIGPVREIVTRHFGLGPRAALYVAPEFVIAFSAAYEIFEWTLAVFMDPASADAYNGQQGDVFDSQKDMAIAAIGAILSTVITIVRGWLRKVTT